MKKIIFVLIALFLLAGCAPGVTRKQAGSTKLSTRLQVKLRPANAKVKVTRLASKDSVIKVRIHVVDYGTQKHPRTRKVIQSWQANVSLLREGYISQGLEIYSPAKDVTATLIPFSTEPDRIRKSFSEAARVYKLPTAYPTYMPKGFKLVRAEYQDNIQSDSPLGSNPNTRFLFLQWSKDKSVILMQFLGSDAGHFGGRPAKYEKPIRISKDLQAKFVLGTNKVDFFQNDKISSWYISAEGLARPVLIKMVKSIKLSE